METRTGPEVVYQTVSSYPTYEEWKLYIHLFLKQYYIGSYPTYEEWKHTKLDRL